MANIDDLVAVLDGLDARARSDPRLDRYRIAGRGPAAAKATPPGWYLSDAMAHLMANGGWWPGHWSLQPDEDDPTPEDVLVNGLPHETRQKRRVRWTLVGSIWERDHFYTPLLRQPATTAPLFGFSAQALWVSMVFPHEVAILEAFVIAYDELGLDESGAVNPFFVEWVVAPPPAFEEPDESQIRVHERLAELSTGWASDHPCWRSDAMPSVGTPERQWSPDIKATVLGVDVQHLAP